MHKTFRFASTLFFLLLILLPNLHAETKSDQDAAVKAAQDWLVLVDGGKFDESWDQAATLFKNAVPKKDWTKMIQTAREPLGKLVERKLKSSESMTTLPGAPDGKYVVIQYESSFENKKTAVETITPMLDRDGAWHVSGYYIR